MTIESNNVAETEGAAAELASRLRGGECVALRGDLGAGKTQFVRGLAAALGVNPRQVCSPTFVLLHIYEGGRLRLYHLDAYRVAGADDFDAIGFAELLDDPTGVVVVEWAERVEPALPARRIDVSFQATGPTSRRIHIVE